jgi:hypothetical protein
MMQQIRGGHAHWPTICDCGIEGLVGGQQAGGRALGLQRLLAASRSRRAPGGAHDDAGAGSRDESLTAGRQAEPVLPFPPGDVLTRWAARTALFPGSRAIRPMRTAFECKRMFPCGLFDLRVHFAADEDGSIGDI